MKKRTLILVWVAAAVLAGALSACTGGALSGVAGSTLTRAEYPRVSITANEPFTLRDHGRLWVGLPTDFLGIEPSGSLDYAVYGQGESGLVTRHAHALFVKPGHSDAWVFQTESYPAPGGLAIGRTVVDDYTWTTQVLRVPSEKDWFSAMWRASGREVPDVWLARRFSATPERTLRVVAEYREPWPECLDPDIKDLVFVREECLGGFLQRAGEAFSLRMHVTEPVDASPPAPQLQRPPSPPDIRKLAGELRENDFAFRKRWR